MALVSAATRASVTFLMSTPLSLATWLIVLPPCSAVRRSASLMPSAAAVLAASFGRLTPAGGACLGGWGAAVAAAVVAVVADELSAPAATGPNTMPATPPPRTPVTARPAAAMRLRFFFIGGFLFSAGGPLPPHCSDDRARDLGPRLGSLGTSSEFRSV